MRFVNGYKPEKRVPIAPKARLIFSLPAEGNKIAFPFTGVDAKVGYKNQIVLQGLLRSSTTFPFLLFFFSNLMLLRTLIMFGSYTSSHSFKSVDSNVQFYIHEIVISFP